MMDTTLTPADFRARARECECLADAASPGRRELFLSIAAKWNRMAAEDETLEDELTRASGDRRASFAIHLRALNGRR